MRTFSYTESCVVLTSDFSTIFGNEYDTVAPEILSCLGWNLYPRSNRGRVEV